VGARCRAVARAGYAELCISVAPRVRDPERDTRLVANHSCAIIGARLCGLACELAGEFPEVDEVVAEALTYCDMTTSPTGQPVDLDTRLKEITDRYGEVHVVTRSMRQAWPHIQAAELVVRSLMGG
jgi:hypothetical protein